MFQWRVLHFTHTLPIKLTLSVSDPSILLFYTAPTLCRYVLLVFSCCLLISAALYVALHILNCFLFDKLEQVDKTLTWKH